MTWDSIQQIIRIVLMNGGAFVFGSEIANGDLYTAAVGGVLSIGAFVWWYFWNRKAAPSTTA